jgi:hypothetical protein
MKRTTLAVVLLVASCRATYTNEFKAIYDSRAQLVKERNINALLAQMTADYTVKLRNGQTMSLADIRARWTFYYDSVLVRHISFVNDIRTVERKDNEAIVTFEQKDHRIQNGPNGKPMEVEADVIHRETWVHTPDGWKLRVTDEGEQTKLLVDGKRQPSK